MKTTKEMVKRYMELVENGNEDTLEFKELEKEIQQITGKDVSQWRKEVTEARKEATEDKNKITPGKLGCLFIFVIFFSFTTYFLEDILYHVYYKPFYAIFGGLYAPFSSYVFYQFVVTNIIFFLIAIVIFVVQEKFIHKFFTALLSLVIIFGLFSDAQNIFNDIIHVQKEGYITGERQLDNLFNTSGGRRSPLYKKHNIRGSRDGAFFRKEETIYMDIYQYKELDKIKHEKIRIEDGMKRILDDNRTILVYYLPNTKRMIKYELMESNTDGKTTDNKTTDNKTLDSNTIDVEIEEDLEDVKLALDLIKLGVEIEDIIDLVDLSEARIKELIEMITN